MGAWTLDPTVTITCELSLDTNPLATPSWDYDVSAYLDDTWSSFRGKTSEHDVIQPGTLTVTFDNSDRRFDPEYTSGPYYGKLTPMKRIRITVAVGVFSATVFTGFIVGYQQHWGPFKGTCTVSCVDGTRMLANAALPASAYSAEVVDDDPSNYWPLQDSYSNRIADGGTLHTDDRAFGGLDFGFFEASYPLGEPNYVTGGTADLLVYPYTPSDLPETIEFWATVTGTADDAVLVQRYVNSTTMMYLRVLGDGSVTARYSHGADNQRVPGTSMTVVTGELSVGTHHLAMRRDASNVYFMIDGSLRLTQALEAGTGSGSGAGFAVAGDAVYFPAGASPSGNPYGVSHAAFYETAPSADRITAHYNVGRWAYTGAHGIYGFEMGGARIGRVLDDIGWPAGDRDLDTGGTRQAAYLPDGQKALDYIPLVEASEQGLFFFDVQGRAAFRDRQYIWTTASAATFSDDGSDTSYSLGDPAAQTIDTMRNIVTATRQSGAITRRDANLVPGTESSETVQSDTISDAQDASNLAAYRLRNYSEAGSTFPLLETDLHDDPATKIPAVLALELGNIVTVERTPMSVGSQLVKKAQVLGIGHHVTADSWTVQLFLSRPVLQATDAPYLILGDPIYGKLGSLGNLLLDDDDNVLLDDDDEPLYDDSTTDGNMIPF